jgi:hypothetical protein
MRNSKARDALRIASQAPLASLVLAVAVITVYSPPSLGGDDTRSNARSRNFFETKIRPILVDNCQSCHGPKKQKGGLRLDSLAAVLEGGETGPAVVPGRPEESLILKAIEYSEDLKMPPKGKLSSLAVASVKEWIAAGAPWPNSEPLPASLSSSTKPSHSADFTSEEKSFWAFQPPVDRPIPEVKQPAWVRTPIDAYILAGLEAKGLAPAPPADRRTLIRRATFDLIGLPPTPEEVADFENDPAPDAFEKVVERLLASPHYGERWGRHWLDVARYADSNGMDENLSFGNAWRYRDYVVRSFNADKPYHRFLAEQIAGDLLDDDKADVPTSAGISSPEHDRIIATGFLVVGPKMLAEDDPVKMEMDIVDEQVDTIGRTFMGLTLGCARCHDHKFDPIRTTDYYGLAGIFKSTKTMENFKVVARWNERPLSSPAEQARKIALEARDKEIRSELNRIVKQANEAIQSAHRAKPGAAPLPRRLEALYPKDVQDRLKVLRDEQAKITAEATNIPSAMAVAEREPVDLKIHIRGSHLTLGEVAPRRFPAIMTGVEHQESFSKGESGRRQLVEWLGTPDHPLTSRVMVNRIWLWHFGSALVRTPDNFGRLGERPTHPELLDWLAREFVRGDWSVKRIHRLLMRSSAYQMSTRYDERADAIDPENRLLWRMNRRRLEAESIRDSILAVSGRLDRGFGGNLLKTPNRAYVAGTASVNGASYQSLRRSLYLPIIRSALYEVLQAFDFADPSTPNGQRDTTTVAPQALCLMNSDLVAESSQALADQILSSTVPNDATRLEYLYQAAYGRSPSATEASRAVSFLNRYKNADELAAMPLHERHRKAWQGLCRVLFESSEFIYVD